MHDYVGVVNEDPLGLRIALDVSLLQASALAVGKQAICYGLDMSIGGARADDEVVGNQCAIAQVDNLDILRLLLFQQSLDYLEFVFSVYVRLLILCLRYPRYSPRSSPGL